MSKMQEIRIKLDSGKYEEQEDTIKAAKNCLVCAAIAPLSEIVANTYQILGVDLDESVKINEVKKQPQN